MFYKYLGVCFLSIFSTASFAVDLLLPDNQWRLISLPSDPGNNNTVKAIFGNDIKNAEYGTNGEWVLYASDAAKNINKIVGYEESLELGKGYWIIQLTGADVTIDMPEGSVGKTNSFKINLEMPQDDQKKLWNLVGNPFSTTKTLNNFSVKTGQNACSTSPCSIDKANEEGIVRRYLRHIQALNIKTCKKTLRLIRGKVFGV